MVTCRLLAAASAAGVPGAAARAARRSAAAAATRWRRAHSALAASPETEPAQQQTWADAAPAAGEAATLAARGTLVATEAVLALELPARLAGEVVSGLRALLLRGGRAVVAAPGGGAASLRRRVLLSPDVAPPGGVAPPAVAALLRRPLALEAGETAPALVTHALVTPYERLTAVQVLRALLPPGVVPPTSFEEAGHGTHARTSKRG